MKKAVLMALCVAMVASAALADFIVESRSGGQNYAWYSQVSTWSNTTSKSTAEGVTSGIGSTYSSNAYTGRSFTVAPNFDAAGLYDVYITAAGNMNVQPITVVHAGGTDNFNADLSTGVANAWKLLGQWTFNAGTGGTVTLASSGAGGAMIRGDAVKFVFIPEPAALALLGLGSLLFVRRRRTA